MTNAPVLIMAGGTGGHVFPALAVARELIGREREVIWLGSPRGIENRLVPEAGIDLERVRVSGLRGKGLVSWVLAPFKVALAVWDALRVVRRCQPAVVLGMGGFASGPGGFAAWLLRRPLLIHEQNTVAGLTNKLLAGIAREVLQAFPGSFSAGVSARAVGNPVRAELFELAAPERRIDAQRSALRVLVLGGSQGALALNQAVPAAAAIVASNQTLDIWHQAGAATLDQARAAYSEAGIEGRVDPFIDDMAEAYGWADMVICRSGALTVSELAAAGLGAILVPYPSAVDDHQTLNAMYLVSEDAAVLMPQDELTAENLAAELSGWAANREEVVARAIRARSLARPEATRELADACLALEAAA